MWCVRARVCVFVYVGFTADPLGQVFSDAMASDEVLAIKLGSPIKSPQRLDDSTKRVAELEHRLQLAEAAREELGQTAERRRLENVRSVCEQRSSSLQLH